MQRRFHRRIVEQGERDAVLRRAIRKRGGRGPVRPGAVEDRRTAAAAKAALIAALAFVIRHKLFATDPAEIRRGHAHAAAKRRAVLPAALRAMAVERALQRPGDLEGDTAAQAASADGGHGKVRELCLVG